MMSSNYQLLLRLSVSRSRMARRRGLLGLRSQAAFSAFSAPPRTLSSPQRRHGNSNDSLSEVDDPNKTKQQQQQQLSTEEIYKLQTQLLNEATYLTKALYRKCLKSIQVLAMGNERDEIDFSERERSEQDRLEDSFVSSSSSSKVRKHSNATASMAMALPVDRANELASRANYYKAFTREHFDGHWNLLGRHGFYLGEEGNMRHGLGADVGRGGQLGQRLEGGHDHHLGGQMMDSLQPYSPQHHQGARSSTSSYSGDGDTNQIPPPQQQEYYMWREEQIEQFTYLIRTGEEKRQWILNDYKFNDPYCDNNKGKQQHWPEELRTRVQEFEEKANVLVKEMYRRRGWIHSSDYGKYASDEREESDSDDED